MIIQRLVFGVLNRIKIYCNPGSFLTTKELKGLFYNADTGNERVVNEMNKALSFKPGEFKADEIRSISMQFQDINKHSSFMSIYSLSEYNTG